MGANEMNIRKIGLIGAGLAAAIFLTTPPQAQQIPLSPYECKGLAETFDEATSNLDDQRNAVMSLDSVGMIGERLSPKMLEAAKRFDAEGAALAEALSDYMEAADAFEAELRECAR
jgi:hypothetical protein